MDILNINFKKLLPYVIDAFTKVYGEEYHDIIEERLNKAIIIQYYDISGLRNYIYSIENYKKRECAIKFLDKIGVDVEKYKHEGYVESLGQDAINLIAPYFGKYIGGFDEYDKKNAPILSLKMEDSSIENKLRIINHLRGNEVELITEENFDSFMKTDEAQEILRKIDELIIIYERVKLEYDEFLKKLVPFENFIHEEDKRRKEIFEKQKKLFFLEVFSLFPPAVLDVISDDSKTIFERMEEVLGLNHLSVASWVEFFSFEEMNKLRSKNVDLLNKWAIVDYQYKYLKSLGVKIFDEKILECDSEEDVEAWLEFINQEDIKKYIPSDEVIKKIKDIRGGYYEKALMSYHKSTYYYKTIEKEFGDTAIVSSYTYDIVKLGIPCVTGNGAFNSINGFVSTMFFPIKWLGILGKNFVHECGHVIDQYKFGIGFETWDSIERKLMNPYDKSFRKYEKFNETLNDIFTMEALDILHEQGIYLIEPKKYTMEDVSNTNTHKITKNILYPLVKKFRKEVIRAKINMDPNELIKCIGKDNFEELVDIVNKVDYLARNRVVSKIDNSPDDEMVKEYFKQVERANKVYKNIDEYYKKHKHFFMNHYVAPNKECSPKRR